MTKIRDLIKSFEIQKSRRHHLVDEEDSVAFEAFYNQQSPPSATKHIAASNKESSLNHESLNKQHDNNVLDDEYPISSCPKQIIIDSVRTNATVHSGDGSGQQRTLVLVLTALGLFLILPSLYLLYCVGWVYLQHTSSTTLLPINTNNNNNNLVLPATINNNKNNYHTKLPPPPGPDYNQCKLINDTLKFDCYPDAMVTPAKCEARGCCWIPAKRKPQFIQKKNSLSTPYCFYPPNYNAYNYLNITTTGFGLVAFMKRTYATDYPDDVDVIKMVVKYETDTRLHVKITDPLHNRFEPPYPEVPIVDKTATNLTYLVYIDQLKSGFKIIRKSDNSTIFDTININNLIFSNQFLQITAKLPPSSFVYGFGEHRSNFLLSTQQWSRFTLFNHDAIPQFNKNLYGSQPFYMVVEKTATGGGNSHGVFLLNSNAMDVILQPTPAVTFRSIGGVFDFYFFLGPTPADVISQYTDLVGRPYMPPFWGLGFHLCRFGYKTLNETRTVMQRNIDAGIPLDTQWNDLDYMNNSNDFTYDKTKFKDLPEFVRELHQRGMHYVPLIDPGVSASEKPGTYEPFDKGLEMNIFVKNSTDQPFIGKVWNTGSTVWPDFTHPNTVDYWTLMLRTLHNDVAFDGAWIDMNEPSNFLSGSFTGCPANSSLEHPPYVPGIDGGVLNYKTMCMSAKHYAGLHYDVHNLYGFTEAIVTSFAMAELRGKRPFVISRATFAGHGHYAGHWSGDVVSEWLDMKYTIPELLNFNLFGIPLMGADICGFNGNTTKELCQRWMQLGAFYPFSRNHNTDDGIDQDPAAFGPDVVASSKRALLIRYSLLPYLYTLFWRAHVYGDTVARPLFFEFPNDVNTFNIDTQFLWGPALMIAPVLEPNTISVQTYLPKGIWYDFYTKSAIIISKEGTQLNLSAPLDTIPLLVRGGYILSQQKPEQTTTALRKNKIELLAAADSDGKSIGELYWDDGDSLNSYEEKRYVLISFVMTKGLIISEIVHFISSMTDLPNLGSITILGIDKAVTEVTVNKISQAFQFDTIHKYLTITNLNVNLSSPFVVSWK